MEETGTNSQSRMFEKMGELPERTTQRMYSLLMEEGVLRPGSVTISNLNANLRKELGVVLAEFGLNRQDPLRTNRPLGSAGVDAVVDTEDESVDVPLGRSTVYTWKGRLRNLPQNFYLPPRTKLRKAWDIWWIGILGQDVPPLRRCRGADFNVSSQKRRYCE